MSYARAGSFGPAAIPGAPYGAQVEVLDSTGALAVLWSDASKNTRVDPYLGISDAGLLTRFFADPGTYTLVWAGGTATVTIAGTPDIPVFGPGTRDYGRTSVPVSGPAWVGSAPTIVSLFQTGHGWTTSSNLTNGGLCNLNDTSVVGVGTQSLKIGTIGPATSFQQVNKVGAPAVDLTTHKLRITLMVQDISKLATLQLEAGPSGGIAGSQFNTWQITNASVANGNPANPPITNGQWATIELSLADGAVTGTPTFTAVTDYRFVVGDNGTGPAIFWISRMDAVPTGMSKFGSNGVVVLCFDDAFAGQYTYARKRLAGYGMQASFFPIVEATTQGGMTVAQLREMQDAYGHEVGAHSFTSANHDGYSALSPDDTELDMRANLDWLYQNGFRSRSFAYPLGYVGGNLETTKRLWSCGRTIGTFGGGLKQIPTPPVDTWALRSVTNVGGTGTGSVPVTTFTTATTGILDRCKLYNSLVIVTLHNIVAGAAAGLTQCSDADLGTLLDAIATKGIAVATLGQVIAASQ